MSLTTAFSNWFNKAYNAVINNTLITDNQSHNSILHNIMVVYNQPILYNYLHNHIIAIVIM